MSGLLDFERVETDDDFNPAVKDSTQDIMRAAASALRRMENVQQTHYESMNHAEKKAKEKGCYLKKPKPCELFLDIDDWERDKHAFRKGQEILEEVFGKGSFTVKSAPSPSGDPNRCHIVVTLPVAVDPFTRIMFQAMMGSDRVRELVSWKQAINGCPHPTVFFERP